MVSMLIMQRSKKTPGAIEAIMFMLISNFELYALCSFMVDKPRRTQRVPKKNPRFTLGHKCRGPQLLLLEGSSSLNKEEDKDEELEEPIANEPTEPEISFHALTGWSTSKTMRITTKIGHYEVVVLIDSGSTHNFINEKVAVMLHLPVVPTEPFNVKVVDGNH
ncbi:hypothetical protein Q3G72_017159 [Acer saccharum]|nr:hypothetical protein Q3G72_017159 [Acer saccharum]